MSSSANPAPVTEGKRHSPDLSLEDVPTQATEASRGEGARVRDRLLVAAFVTMLILPALAFLAGLRPPNFENRVFATMPTLSMVTLSDATFFRAMDAYATDNFPLRTDAIGLKAGFVYDVLGASISPLVVRGADGWLYYSDEVNPKCPEDVASLLANVDGFSTEFADRGIAFWYVVAPDKRTMYPEHLGSSSDIPCTETGRDELREGMKDRPGTMIDLWSPMMAARSADSELLYWPRDTHWNYAGALVGVKTLIDAVAPGLWDPSAVRNAGTVEQVGDLAELSGLQRADSAPHVVVQRSDTLDVTDISNNSASGTPWYTTSGPDAVIPGRTLFVTDSFFWDHQDMVAPWFAESVWVKHSDLVASPDIGASFPQVDRVVFAIAERYSRVGGMSALLNHAQPEMFRTTTPPLTAADPQIGGRCNFDGIGPSAFQNGLAAVGSARVIDIRGWAFDDQQRLIPEATYVVLEDQRQTAYYLPVSAVVRPDVAEYFGDSELNGSGFEGTASTVGLANGLYHALVLMRFNGRSLECDSGLSVLVEG